MVFDEDEEDDESGQDTGSVIVRESLHESLYYHGQYLAKKSGTPYSEGSLEGLNKLLVINRVAKQETKNTKVARIRI